MVKSSFLKTLTADAKAASLSFSRLTRGQDDGGDASSSVSDASLRAHPVEVVQPQKLTTPVIFASPHSGRRYPSELLKLTKLDQHTLRLSEDSYVDLLIDCAPRFGAPIIKARFPRAYVDVNRSAKEIDPAMFQGGASAFKPGSLDRHSSRVLAGLGVIPKIVADGRNIYTRKLPPEEAYKRLTDYYEPYHQFLSNLIMQAQQAFGVAVVIDCHSMPSAGGAPLRQGEPTIDFVLGDRFGVSCAPCLPSLIERRLHQFGSYVVRNAPYAGGYVANAYGRPNQGVHVLQIEINRKLYLDEQKITRTPGFELLKALFEDLIGELVAIDPTALQPAQAAE